MAALDNSAMLMATWPRTGAPQGSDAINTTRCTEREQTPRDLATEDPFDGYRRSHIRCSRCHYDRNWHVQHSRHFCQVTPKQPNVGPQSVPAQSASKCPRCINAISWKASDFLSWSHQVDSRRAVWRYCWAFHTGAQLRRWSSDRSGCWHRCRRAQIRKDHRRIGQLLVPHKW